MIERIDELELELESAKKKQKECHDIYLSYFWKIGKINEELKILRDKTFTKCT